MIRRSPNRFSWLLYLALAYGLCITAPVAAQTHTLSGGAIVNPEGLYSRYTRQVAGEPSGPGLALYNSFLFYSNEFGVQLRYATDPAVLLLQTDLGAEPGYFRRKGATTRSARWRANVRTRATVNLKLDSFWFYSRTTGLFRYRNFVENDTIAQIEIAREWSIEQATAPFVRVWSGGNNEALWGYIEHTIGSVADAGVRTNRASFGVLTENWPGKGVTLNLDLFWSFARPLTGPGAIFIYYIYW